ncbi:MAG: signal peptidase II [Acidobacteriota bacterium]
MSFRGSLALAAVVALLDQLTKALVVSSFPLGAERVVIPGLFSLVHTRNRGIAFGFLGSSGPVVQIVLLAVVALVVLLLARQLARSGTDAVTGAGLALVLGGAVGNLIDRVMRGEVVDFLDFYLRIGGHERHWWAFNLADSAITVGAIGIVLAELLRPARREHAPRSD